MSEEYTLEEIELTEDFGRHIHNWYCENRIVDHPLSRADYVRANNQRVQVIFNDLKELNYLIEERKYNEALSHHGWMDDEARELVTQPIIDWLEKHRVQVDLIEKNDDF
jgi:hypothetical protein